MMSVYLKPVPNQVFIDKLKRDFIMKEHILRACVRSGMPFGKSVRLAFGISKCYYVKEAILFFSRTYVSDLFSHQQIQQLHPETSTSKVDVWRDAIFDEDKSYQSLYDSDDDYLSVNDSVVIEKSVSPITVIADVDEKVVVECKKILLHLTTVGVWKINESQSYFILSFGYKEISVADHAVAVKMHSRGGLVDRALVCSLVQKRGLSHAYIDHIINCDVLLGGVRYGNRNRYKELFCSELVFFGKESGYIHYGDLQPTVSELMSPSFEYYVTRLTSRYHHLLYARCYLRYINESEKAEGLIKVYLEHPTGKDHILTLSIVNGICTSSFYIDVRKVVGKAIGFRFSKDDRTFRMIIKFEIIVEGRGVLGFSRQVGVYTTSTAQNRGTKYNAEKVVYADVVDLLRVPSFILKSCQDARDRNRECYVPCEVAVKGMQDI